MINAPWKCLTATNPFSMNKPAHHIPIEFSNFLKLLACFVIVIHHFSQYGLDSHKVSGVIFEVFRSVGGDLSVTIFFFLSGYGLMVSESKKKFEIKRFASKRFWRILEPFWLVNFVAVIIYWILGADNIATHSIMHAVGSILGVVRFDSTMWFIHYLLILYILFAIGMLLHKPIFFVGSSILAFIIIAIINNLPSHLWSSLFAFPFGMMVGLKPEILIRFFRRYEVLVLSILTYGIVLYVFVFGELKNNGPLWHQLNNILIVIVLLFAVGRMPARFINWYKISPRLQPYYEMYLVHPKILFITIFCLGIFLPLWSLLLITIIIALAFCNISFILKLCSHPINQIRK